MKDIGQSENEDSISTSEEISTSENSQPISNNKQSSCITGTMNNEQILVHRWYLSEVDLLLAEGHSHCLQSNPFGCTGENGFLQWLVRFHCQLTSEQIDLLGLSQSRTDIDDHVKWKIQEESDKSNHSNSITKNESIENKEQTIDESTSKITAAHSSESSEENSSSVEKSFCAFEIRRSNLHQTLPETLFETNYEIYTIADDGASCLLTETGRRPIHFSHAWIRLARSKIRSDSSKTILLCLKLNIHESSSSLNHCSCVSTNIQRKTSLTNEQNDEISASFDRGEINENFRLKESFDTTLKTHVPIDGHVLWTMMIERNLTDLILRSCDDQEFHVHRFVLNATCPSIMTQVPSDLSTMVMSLESIDGETLQSILKYLYTDEIQFDFTPFSIGRLRNLFEAANRYKLISFKQKLIKQCLSSITEDNVFHFLQLADDENLHILKRRLFIFLCQQTPQLLNVDDWRTLSAQRAHLNQQMFDVLIDLNRFQKLFIDQLQKEKINRR